MQEQLTKWDDDVSSTPDEEYSSLVRSLRRRKGFGLEFVRCSPAGGKELIAKVRKDLPQKTMGVLALEEPITNLIDKIKDFPNQENLNILFITGLEKSLVAYIRPGYGGTAGYYNLDTIPPILSHLNWQRENFRDYFRHLCFVFLLPSFAIKYILRRAPDFFDWGSGIVDFPTDSFKVKMASMFLYRERTELEDYRTLTGNERTEKLLEIQELIDEPNQEDYTKADLYSEQGLIHAMGQEYEEAIASYDRAVAINPDYHGAWNNRGIALGKLGRYEEAIASYDRTVEIKPGYHEAWYNRGNSLGNLGRYEEAIASYDRAVEIKPDDHEAWNNRGIALGKLGRYEEAIASYDRAVEIKSDKDVAWNNRGNALDDLGRYEEAIASYDRAVEIKPDYHEAWNNRGIALRQLGRYEEAIASFDRTVAIKPDDHEAWNNRGNALGKLGRYEEAIASYDRAVGIKPDDANPFYNLACCYALQTKIDLALENLQKVINLSPEKYRNMAKTDTDFDSIRHDPRFQALIIEKET